MLLKRFTLVAAVTASALLGACARSDNSYADSASGTVVTDNIRIDDVTLGKGLSADKKVAEATSTFSPTDTIHASVKTVGLATGAVLTAKWMFEDSVMVADQVQTISPNGDTYTDFHITKGTPWPKGKYKVTVMLNGKETETEGFTVK